jgi:hypothetical protein
MGGISQVLCIYKAKCIDYPRKCDKCKHNTGNKSYFQPTYGIKKGGISMEDKKIEEIPKRGSLPLILPKRGNHINTLCNRLYQSCVKSIMNESFDNSFFQFITNICEIMFEDFDFEEVKGLLKFAHYIYWGDKYVGSEHMKRWEEFRKKKKIE